MKKIKNLLIFAHPDDETLAMGGYISKKIINETFKVIFIAEGSSCRYSEKKINSKETKKVINSRNKMALSALKSLGVKNIKFFNFPCGRLDTVSIIKINKIIEEQIKLFKPNNIFTHNSKDCNNDHRIVNRSVMMATRPNIKNKFLNKLLTCEILSSSEWNYEENFIPNYFEILSEKNIEEKIRAFQYFKSEYQNEPSPRNSRGIKILASYRGLQCGQKFAEAFQIVKIFSK